MLPSSSAWMEMARRTGPRIIPALPKAVMPQNITRIRTRKDAFMPVFRNKGLRKLSADDTMLTLQTSRATAAMGLSIIHKCSDRGIQTSAVPKTGMGARMAASSPQKANCLMPTRAKPMAHRKPWIMATSTTPSKMARRAWRMATEKRCSIRGLILNSLDAVSLSLGACMIKVMESTRKRRRCRATEEAPPSSSKPWLASATSESVEKLLR